MAHSHIIAGASVAGLLGAFTLGFAAEVQQAAPVVSPAGVMLHRGNDSSHNAYPATRRIRGLTSAPDATSAADAKEIVLHGFASPARGAYPANGVIRDLEGNLYGTTNGSYSDIGGGGARDAGVIFKIDSAGCETVLYTFKGDDDGSSPNGLVRDADGNLYGTTTNGGAGGAGVVFELDTSGHERVLYSFTGGNDGGNPEGLIRDQKGNLYGTTENGGAPGYGVVFKVDRSGKETVLYAFKGGADGAYPNAFVDLDGEGNVYGAANAGGGASGAGVVFKVGPSGHETVLYTFTGGKDGAQPNGVSRDVNGYLYGTTTNGGAAGMGVVFSLDPSGQEHVLYAFKGGDDGAYSDAGVTRDSKGNLYGTTANGGTANAGVVFKVEPSGRETVLHSFTRGDDGNQPFLAGVVLDPAGNLYGTTSFGGFGGAGTVYKLDPCGEVTVLYGFPGVLQGQYPYNAGVTLGLDGHLYGSTFYGGERGAGVVYELDEHGAETVLHSFDLLTTKSYGQPSAGVTRDAAGNLYGVTFIGEANAGFGYGVVYKIDVAGHATVLHNFTGGADGGDAYGEVILDPKGNVYGTASVGGDANNGVVFKLDPSGHETVLYTFTGGADGAGPYGSLIRDAAGNLYGTTNGGGASNAGVVFKLEPSGHEMVLYSFTGGDDGGYPLGGLVRDSEGNLYGVTNGGGAAASGVVFKLAPSGQETVLHTFSGGDDGGSPLWVTLARDAAGNLYGTTVVGGTGNEGVVFKVDKAGHESVLHSFTGGDDGGNPYAGVILGSGGELYGTTAFGGPANVGVVFEIKP